jgi:hypothetical protein
LIAGFVTSSSSTDSIYRITQRDFTGLSQDVIVNISAAYDLFLLIRLVEEHVKTRASGWNDLKIDLMVTHVSRTQTSERGRLHEEGETGRSPPKELKRVRMSQMTNNMCMMRLTHDEL